MIDGVVMVAAGLFAHEDVDDFVVVFGAEVFERFVFFGEAGFFGFGELDAALAEFEGFETGEALADVAEFGCVHVGAAGQFEEPKLELLLGEVFDAVVVRSFEVLAGVVILGDLPGGVKAAEGAGGDGEVEFFGCDAGGVFGAVLFVDVDELLFLVGSEARENRVNFAGRTRRLGIGDFGLGIWGGGRGLGRGRFFLWGIVGMAEGFGVEVLVCWNGGGFWRCLV